MTLNIESAFNKWKNSTPKERIKISATNVRNKIIPFNDLKDMYLNNEFDKKNIDNHIIFSHIFKTAGSTLIAILAKNYRIQSMIHVNAPVLHNNYLLLKKNNDIPRVMMGHFSMADFPFHVLQRKNLINLILFRDPIDRVVSYYNHIRFRKRHKLHKIVSKLSVYEFVKENITENLWNGQYKWLTGETVNTNEAYSHEHHIQIMKQCILNNYSLVGIQNRFDEFLIMASKLLKWDDIHYKSQNISQKTIFPDLLCERTLNLIKQTNMIDLELFSFVNKLVNKRNIEIDLNKKSIIKFKKTNSKYKKFITTF